MAGELHEQAFQIVDCTRCANCCKTMDIKRIARHLKMEKAEFIKAYLEADEEDGPYKVRQKPCPFLGEDDCCTIYEVRSTVCREYPHTNKDGFTFRTMGVASNALVCPAVFWIVEQMKREALGERSSRMLLSPDDAEFFFRLHRSLMFFVNERLQIIPDIGNPDEFSALPPELRLEVRNAFLDETDLIELFVDANPFDLSNEELDVVHSWRHQVAGKFYIFRYLKKYTVFLSTDDPAIAYGVVALTELFEDLVGPYLPVMTETVLMPLGDKIVYDGLLSSYNITFGGGIKRSLNESYKQAKERLGIVTSLPIEARPVTKKKPKKTRRKATRTLDEVKESLEVIVSMTDQFFREHLNDEYATLCRKFAGKLARKCPSPLLSGRPTTWASGIVRTIGWVNYLDDSTTTPHMKQTAIDKAFGVGESTGQGKSKAIRKMLKIRPFDMNWTLPSRMDDNLMGWMIEVNGFAIDVRHASREIQEIAFEKGLIPYIPADRLDAEVM